MKNYLEKLEELKKNFEGLNVGIELENILVTGKSDEIFVGEIDGSKNSTIWLSGSDEKASSRCNVGLWIVIFESPFKCSDVGYVLGDKIRGIVPFEIVGNSIDECDDIVFGLLDESNGGILLGWVDWETSGCNKLFPLAFFVRK